MFAEVLFLSKILTYPILFFSADQRGLRSVSTEQETVSRTADANRANRRKALLIDAD